jgi:ABC-type sugar transport system substrate-binding protein
MLRSLRSPRSAAGKLGAICLALTCSVAIAACGGDDDSGGSAAAGDGGGDKVPKKSIVYAQLVGDASEIAARESQAVKMATDALGWELQYIEGGGDIPGMIQGITGAINGGVDAVLIAATDAPLVAPVFELAERRDVPVIAVGGEIEPSDQYDAIYTESEGEMSRMLTEQMIEDIGGQGTVAVLDNSQISAGVFRQQAREEALEGTDIETVDRQDSDLADLIGGSKRAVASMLTRNPDVDALWLVYDAMMPPALEALNARNNKTSKVYSWFANPSNLEVMRRNENVQALVDSNIDHTDLIALDQLARFFADGTPMDPAALEKCGLRYEVVTRDNMPPAGEINMPVADNVEPFVANWDKGVYGEGAGCS